MVISGSDSGAVTTPILDFSLVASAILSYSARRTSTFDSTGIIVEASLDGGQTFQTVVLDSAEALPGATSSYETVSRQIPPTLLGQPSVQLRIRATGNSGGNCRLDDIKIRGIGVVTMSTFGFSQTTSTVVGGSDTAVVDLSLNVIPASGQLYGLQFDVTWTSGASILGIERGASVSDPNTWDFAVQLDQDRARVVLLGKTSSGLPVGTHSDVLRILTIPPPIDSTLARIDTLSLGGIIGSRSADTGDDILLAAGHLTHVMTVVLPVASFMVSVDSLDFGLILADSIETLTARVYNPTGTIPLDVSSITPSDPSIVATPSSFLTNPGDSTDVLVSVDAGLLGPGPFSGYVTFFHNGLESPDSIFISGRVGALSTRGDVNDDGLTDLLDLVLAIDHVVGKIGLSQEMAARIDLHPFPAGDGSSDVRDLTVLVRAINRGLWPDGEPLPTPLNAAKGQNDITATMYVSRESGADVIRVGGYPDGLRAVQVVFGTTGRLEGLEPQDFSTLDHGSLVQTHIDRYRGDASGYIGLIAYTLEGSLTEAPEFSVALVEPTLDTDSLFIVFGMGIDQANRRVRLEFGGAAEVPSGTLPSLLPAFPQPFSLSRHRWVRVGADILGSIEIDVTVTDVLGRTVYVEPQGFISGRQPYSWDGSSSAGDALSPGVYFITLATEENRRTVPVVITR